jgi:hypothetical protein
VLNKNKRKFKKEKSITREMSLKQKENGRYKMY